VGAVVTVEGEVASARAASDTVVLEFSGDPRAFRVVLLVPLLSSRPPDPERLYQGKRVRVTGRVQRFQGRAEMVLRSPDQIAIVEPRPAEPRAAAPSRPPAPSPLPVPATAPPPVEARRPLGDAAPCERARARWREAAAAAAEHAAALGHCLEAMSYRCRADSAALAPALDALESIERQVEAACP
jgi:hypothetical protein